MPGLLLTSVSAKQPLVDLVLRDCADARDPWRVVLGDANAMAPAMLLAEDQWVMPRLDSLSPDEFVREVHQRHIQGIVPTRDGELAYLAEIAPSCRDSGVAVLVGDVEAVAACRDKVAFAARCVESGINAIPTFTRIEDVSSTVTRLVVKERCGSGSRGIVLGVSREHAAAAAASMDSPIFQPHIEGSEISVDVYTSLGGEFLGGIARSRDVVAHGESQVTTVIPGSPAVSVAEAIVRAVGLVGHAVVQLIDDGQALHVIECNPRIGGASTLSLSVGLPSIQWFVAEASGRDPLEIPFEPPSEPHQLVRVTQDRIR
jgi:carbamoyl-phosphate synthase large subunit